MEKFDPITNSFSYVTPMPTKRFGSGAAAIGDRILVIGGCGDKKQTPTALVERLGEDLIAGWQGGEIDLPTYLSSYNPIEDKWTALTPMPTARLYLGVAALDRYVYAVGGQLANKQLTAVVERFVQSLSLEYDKIKDEMRFLLFPATIPRATAGRRWRP